MFLHVIFSDFTVFISRYEKFNFYLCFWIRIFFAFGEKSLQSMALVSLFSCDSPRDGHIKDYYVRFKMCW